MTEERPVVTVKQGKLRGTVGTLLDGGSYYAFKGIPYATPPVGDLRFKAPLPPKSWSGLREAAAHGPACPQYDVTAAQGAPGAEDCLYLNVYSTSLAARAPVMVFIHGGGFMSGSGDDAQYGPQFLLKRDVVLVTLNYRLEAFGFLALDTAEVPGNAGMKDQVLALRWVKENIGSFGGDAGSVTIFGESAGGVSVAYHLLSPMSRGLFHRAAVHSGTCLQDWALAAEPRARAHRVGKLLGKDTTDPDELLQFLRGVPAEDLVKVTFRTATADEKRGPALPVHFVPNVEKKFAGVEAFLPEDPLDLLLAKKYNPVPLLIGYTSAEGMIILEMLARKKRALNSEPSLLVPRGVSGRVSAEKVKEFGERILKFYTKGGFDENSTDSLVDYATDVNFAYQTHRFVHLYSSDVPMYMYRFEYETDLNVLKNLLGFSNLKGACHADDLFYFFCGILNKDLYEEQERLRSIVDGLTKMWTDFARTGNPTPVPGAGPRWVPFTAANQEYMTLGDVIMMKKRADQERVHFWNRLYCDAGLPCITKSNL